MYKTVTALSKYLILILFLLLIHSYAIVNLRSICLSFFNSSKQNNQATDTESLSVAKQFKNQLKSSRPVQENSPWIKIKDYILNKQYDAKRNVWGDRIAYKAPEIYTSLKFYLNNLLFSSALRSSLLMPLKEEGTTPVLLERSHKPCLLPKPLFMTRANQEQMNSVSAFFVNLTKQHPGLNIFIFNIINREHSNIYENLLPLSRYKRNILPALNSFQKNLPSSITYKESQLNIDNYKESFFISDHHWTPKGAYQGYRTVIEMMRSKGINIDDPVEPGMYRRISNRYFSGSYAKTAAFKGIKEEVWDFDVKLPAYKCFFNDRFELPRNDKDLLLAGMIKNDDVFENYYQVIWGSDYGLLHYVSDAGTRSLLMFVDSFSNCIEQYFTTQYKDIFIVDLRHYEKDMGSKFKLADFLRHHHIDDVLFFMNTKFLFDSQKFPFHEMLGE